MIRAVFLFAVLAVAAAAQTVTNGQVIPSIAALDKPSDTYALYLPSYYTQDRKWPVVYAFDPIARGNVPVEMMKDMAEKYGYILVGSNVSRNGPIDASIDAAKIMWDDTHSRLSIDPARRYVTGFSGGARASTVLALLCKDCVAGVIAHGAGFPPQITPTKDNVKFVYYATTGDLDFNYVELLKLDDTLNELGIPHRMRYFSGGHQYATPEVWQEIFAWLELQAMKRGLKPKNEAFIKEQLAAQEKRQQELEAKGDRAGLYHEIARGVADFTGLADINQWQTRAKELAADKSVKDALKEEKRAMDLQARLTSDAYRDLNLIMDDPAERTEPLIRLRQHFSGLRDQVKKAREKGKENDPEIMILRRTLLQILAQAVEMGQMKMRAKDYSTALIFFDIAADFSRQPGYAHYEKARIYALMGRKKDIIPELRKAVQSGMQPKDVAETKEFAEFRETPEFKEMLASAKPPENR